MRFLAIVAAIPILAALGALFIVMGQQRLSIIQQNKLEEYESQQKMLKVDLSNTNILKASLVPQVAERMRAMRDLEDRLDKKAQELQEKEMERKVCEGEKTATNNKLAELQKEKADAEGHFKTEAEEWSKEIASLKEQMATRSKICDYVTKTEASEKLCGPK